MMLSEPTDSEIEESKNFLRECGYLVIRPDDLESQIAAGSGVSMKIINGLLAFIAQAQHPRHAVWAVAYVFDALICRVPPSRKAEELGITKQAISRLAKAFQNANPSLPKSKWLKEL